VLEWYQNTRTRTHRPKEISGLLSGSCVSSAFWGCPGHFVRSSRGSCKRWIPTFAQVLSAPQVGNYIYAQGVLLMRKLLFSLPLCFKYCRSAADQPKPDQLGRADSRVCDLYKPDCFAKISIRFVWWSLGPGALRRPVFIPDAGFSGGQCRTSGRNSGTPMGTTAHPGQKQRSRTP
jgi:hypothetical protein